MSLRGWRIGIVCTKAHINLDILLNCGQCFRWKRKNDVEWIGVIGHHVWRLRQTGPGISYLVYGQRPMDKKVVNGTRSENSSSKETKSSLELEDEVTESFSRPRNETETYAAFKERTKTDRIKLSASIKKEVGVDDQPKPRKRLSKVESVKTLQTKCSKLANVSESNECKDETFCYQSLPALFQNCQNIILKTETTDISLKEKTECDDDDRHLFSSGDCEKILGDYFQLNINLCELYDHWSSQDSHFKEVAGKFEGICMLRQDPTENLLSFVCSSNNHISRISSMVEKLCIHYGDFIAEVDGEKYYSFPTLSALTGDGVEGHLRELGFGYRAKFIAAIAKCITQEKEEGWLDSLREWSYQVAKTELMKLLGVGAKVADCVCLMSLDKPQSVPVDTHVWQITQKNYMAKLQHAKSLTDRLYNEIGDFYRNLWGPYAGWAHSVLFTADLKHNKAKDSANKSSRDVDEKNKGGKRKKTTEGGKRKMTTEVDKKKRKGT